MAPVVPVLVPDETGVTPVREIEAAPATTGNNPAHMSRRMNGAIMDWVIVQPRLKGESDREGVRTASHHKNENSVTAVEPQSP